MKLTPKEQAEIDIKLDTDVVAVLRLAADDWDSLPAWRRWLAERLSGRNWGYALRVWADLAVRRDDDQRRIDQRRETK